MQHGLCLEGPPLLLAGGLHGGGDGVIQHQDCAHRFAVPCKQANCLLRLPAPNIGSDVVRVPLLHSSSLELAITCSRGLLDLCKGWLVGSGMRDCWAGCSRCWVFVSGVQCVRPAPP